MSEQWISNWGQELALAGCEQCDWVYLLPPDKLPLTCPHCGRDELDSMDETADSPIYTHPPELLIPFTISQTALASQIQTFASGIWFAPQDLNAGNLIGRLQPLYMPMWLVDADVQAQWQAEVGFNYQIVSHRDRNVNGRWQSQEVQKTKVRWEPRVGTLTRHYDNTTAPALEDHKEMLTRLGQYDRQKAQPYQAAPEALVRLPNRPPDDAWTEATAVLQSIAGDDCRRAAGGDHLREFRWSANFQSQNWTQLLLPLYSTYYLDDDNQPQVVLVNGQSGKIDGRKRASMKRAQTVAITIAVMALILFVVGMALSYWGEAGVREMGSTAVTASFFAFLAALFPIIYVWQFNQSH
jgi:hypothetical protein